MPILFETPGAHPLAELAPIQPGRIVSQVLRKNAGGSVTLFSFAEGEGLSEHTAPFDALLVVTRGEAAVTIAQDEHRVAAGEAVGLPARVPHAVQATTDLQMLLIMLRTPS